MTGDGADIDAVEHQIEQGSQPEYYSAGKSLKADRGVVADVVAEHHEVALGFALAAEPRLELGIVHRLDAADR